MLSPQTHNFIQFDPLGIGVLCKMLTVIAAQTRVSLTAIVTRPTEPYGAKFVIAQNLVVPTCTADNENGVAMLAARTANKRTEKPILMKL